MKTSPKQVKDKVEWCLKNKEVTRNDDMLLVLSVWKNFHRNDFTSYIRLCMNSMEMDIRHVFQGVRGEYKNLPSMESIRRVRQKFQENGEYLPTDPKVTKERGRKIAEFVEFARGNND